MLYVLLYLYLIYFDLCLNLDWKRKYIELIQEDKEVKNVLQVLLPLFLYNSNMQVLFYLHLTNV